MSEKNIIGRKKEIQVLKKIWNSQEAELLAIYGRRRVGKTHLIREYFSGKGKFFEITGQKEGSLRDQLHNFIKAFSKTFYNDIPLARPKSWNEAFEILTKEIEKQPKSKKLILFFDELPWLATKRSKILQALDYFWNRYWSSHRNILLIVCGSAASWMLDNLINAKGGLYNRVTETILLRPYNLKGVQEFLKHRKISLNQKQILDLYMAFGGIPFYLKQAARSKSSSQTINDVCFQKEGLLYNEFERLFHSLFNYSEVNLSIIRVIAKRRQGASREEILQEANLSSGGRVNSRLKELEVSGLIQSYTPYGKKKKNCFYRISDEYTYFYLRWIEPLRTKGIEGGKSYWQKKAKTPGVNSWSGYVFENVCLKHIDQIQEALGFATVSCEVGSWKWVPKKGTKKKGTQIDLLFDRDDGVITLCEIKYSEKPFVIDKIYAKELMNKIDIFEKYFLPNKQIFLSMITTQGTKHNLWSEELVESEVKLNDLFKF